MKELKLGIYRHYKGNKYLILGKAKHSETLEELVVYVTLYDNEMRKIWVRPLQMFFEVIEVDGKIVPRFEYLGEK